MPILVNRLEDEDEAVRFFAIIALEKITGQRFGYEYSKPLAARTRSVELWREYLKSPDRALSMEREAHSGRGVTNATSNQGL